MWRVCCETYWCGVLCNANPIRSIDKVDATMSEIQEQTQLANEVSEAISTSAYTNVELDDVRFLLFSCAHNLIPYFFFPPCIRLSTLAYRTHHAITTARTQDELRKELEEMEDDQLNERLREAEHVPIHQPAGATRESLSPPARSLLRLLTTARLFRLYRIVFCVRRDEGGRRGRRDGAAQGATTSVGNVRCAGDAARHARVHGSFMQTDTIRTHCSCSIASPRLRGSLHRLVSVSDVILPYTVPSSAHRFSGSLILRLSSPMSHLSCAITCLNTHSVIFCDSPGS